MGKLKDAHIFSQEKGSIAKFFVFVAALAACMFIGGLIPSLIHKEPFDWWGMLLTVIVLAALFTADYFIARLLAYHTKIFPKTENREGIHGVSFIFLMIISIILLLVFI